MNTSSIFTSSALNGFLQQSGYYKDKENVSEESKKSDHAHIFYGFRSSVFITNDKKLYERALSIKERLKLETKIVWATECIKELSIDN